MKHSVAFIGFLLLTHLASLHAASARRPNILFIYAEANGVYCALSGKLHQQPARNFPHDAFVRTGDLDAVIKAAGDKPWLFWCNPGDTHAPWWRHAQPQGPQLRAERRGSRCHSDVAVAPRHPRDARGHRSVFLLRSQDRRVRRRHAEEARSQRSGGSHDRRLHWRSRHRLRQWQDERVYDLEADPWAAKNLINDPAHGETLDRLRKEFSTWRTFTKDDDEPFKLGKSAAAKPNFTKPGGTAACQSVGATGADGGGAAWSQVVAQFQ